MKYKLTKNNSLSKTIKKVNYKGNKISKFNKGLLTTTAVIQLGNFFSSADLSQIIKILNTIIIPFATISICSSIKQVNTVKYEEKLNSLIFDLSARENIFYGYDSFKDANIVSKKDIKLIEISSDACIIEKSVGDNYRYAFYKDGEFTEITNVVNENLQKKKNRKRRQRKKYSYESYEFVEEN